MGTIYEVHNLYRLLTLKYNIMKTLSKMIYFLSFYIIIVNVVLLVVAINEGNMKFAVVHSILLMGFIFINWLFNDPKN